MAQLIVSKDRELYYHTWEKENSTYYYDIDFLIIEVKSSGLGKHDSLCEFAKKYSKHIKIVIFFRKKTINRKRVYNLCLCI